MEPTKTQIKILKTAECLIQKRGYNAFSYRDLSEVLGIKTSSIHYHYPTKEELAVAVIKWQKKNQCRLLDEIRDNNALSTKEKLILLVDKIIAVTYKDDFKMCLGGMFASDMHSLSEDIRNETRSFFNYLREWIEGVLVDGQRKGDYTIKVGSSVEKFACYVLIQIEGGLLLSRLYEDSLYVELVKEFISEVIS